MRLGDVELTIFMRPAPTLLEPSHVALHTERIGTHGSKTQHSNNRDDDNDRNALQHDERTKRWGSR